MRTAWGDDELTVLIHQRRSTLLNHWGYETAKTHRDVENALTLCEDLATEEILVDLWDKIVGLDPRPEVIAPAMPIGQTKNALARTFAAFLARELTCDLNTGIIQTNAVKRDLIKSPYFRMCQAPTFGGPVRAGGHYILVDDLYTLGGTLACLRGYIVRQGGVVVGMTTLGEKEGKHVRISLAKSTHDALNIAHDGALAPLVFERAGFDVSCLTEAEGRYLLEQPYLDGIRAGFNRV